jgi:hypothetical protein
MASITLVVVEVGSDWPEFVCGDACDVVALSQASGEPDGIMLQRACERAGRSGAVVQLAVMACNAEADDESIHWRAFTASRLLTAVARTEGGRLILSASKGASAALRLGLLGLATTLADALPERSASVSVRVGDRMVWPVARPAVGPVCRDGSLLGTWATEPLLAMTRRDGRAEPALLAPELPLLSPNAWDLDARCSSRPKAKGGPHERKPLPS